MMLTEEEAKTRWCPFARAVAPVVDTSANVIGGTPANRGSGGAPDPDCRCLASGCMAWRKPSGSQKGYCGLARAP